MLQPRFTDQSPSVTTGGSLAGSCYSSPGSIDEDALSELMVEYQNGSPAAFTELYVRLKPHLAAVFPENMDGDHSAERLTEKTFLEAHRARHTYIPPRPVTPWIEAIARHVASQHVRTRTDQRR